MRDGTDLLEAEPTPPQERTWDQTESDIIPPPPPRGQTNRCKLIIFPQLRWRALTISIAVLTLVGRCGTLEVKAEQLKAAENQIKQDVSSLQGDARDADDKLSMMERDFEEMENSISSVRGSAQVLGTQMRKILVDNPQLQGSLSSLQDGTLSLRQDISRCVQPKVRTDSLNSVRIVKIPQNVYKFFIDDSFPSMGYERQKRSQITVMNDIMTFSNEL